MKVLILSKSGDGAGIAYKLFKEGHHVDLWIEDRKLKDTLKGFVGRPESWRPIAATADLVLSDCAGYSKYAEIFGRLGKPMIGFNPVGDVLELDYKKRIDALHKVGIETPPYEVFNNPKEALQLSWDSPTGYNICSYDSYEDILCETEEIYKWALSQINQNTEVIVTQNLLSDESVEVYVEGWFNGINWIEPFSYAVCSHEASVLIPTDRLNKLIKATVFRLSPILSRAGYRGPISIECVVTKDKVYATEVECSFNDDYMDAFMTGLTEPVGAFLFDVATGLKKQISLAKGTAGFDFLGSVEICRDDPESGKDMPVCGLNDQDLKFTYFYNMYKDSSCPRFTGADDLLMTATAFGRSVKEVQHRINKLCKNIKAVDIYYKTSLGDIDRGIELLKEWSWI